MWTRRQYVLLLLIVCAGVALRLANFGNVAGRSPDEYVYTDQAKTWNQYGAAGLRQLVLNYEADPELKLYPPPTRVGMIRLVALTMRSTGRADEGAGALLSCGASIAALMLLALIGLRFLPPGAALCACLFYAGSLAELVISRRTWSDALVELVSLFLIWLTCEITRNPSRRGLYLMFALAGSLGITLKEAMPVPYGLCALWILFVLVRRGRSWPLIGLFACATAAGLGMSLAWLADAVGGFSHYLGIVSGIPAANAANPYALEYASGPPWLLLDAFWITSPLPLLLAAVGLWPAWKDLRTRWLAVFVVIHLAIAMAMPHWLNLRYVGATFGPFFLLAGLGFWFLIACQEKARRGKAVAVGAIAIVLACATADYLRFRRMFVTDATVDLSIKMLRDEAAGVAPAPVETPDSDQPQ